MLVLDCDFRRALCPPRNDKGRLNGYQKSTKHWKAETLIARGVDIQVLS